MSDVTKDLLGAQTTVDAQTVDRAWARFCGAFGDGPDAPYPGMIAAFETHYGQSFRDKEWRTEAACWAAAWSKATARAEASTAEPQPGANSAPIEAIGRILTEVMDEAARNGAGSRSMPDDYVEVAAWLCGVGTKTPQPDADGAWKASVIDQLIIAHILTAEHESNPLKAVQDLLAYHADIAVDPRVSGAAAKLVEQAKAEEREACVTLADQLWSKGPGVVMAAIRARGQK